MKKKTLEKIKQEYLTIFMDVISRLEELDYQADIEELEYKMPNREDLLTHRNWEKNYEIYANK